MQESSGKFVLSVIFQANQALMIVFLISSKLSRLKLSHKTVNLNGEAKTTHFSFPLGVYVLPRKKKSIVNLNSLCFFFLKNSF